MGISSYLLSQDLASFLITVVVQAILISLIGFISISLLSKRSAPVRSLVCAGTITALGLVLVISTGFRSFDIAWTQPTLPDLLGENRGNSILFSEPEKLIPVETIKLTSPSQLQVTPENDLVYGDSANSFPVKKLAVLLVLAINLMGFVWLMGFLFQLLRLVYGVILVKKFRDSLPSVPDASFNEMVRAVAGAFWKSRMPELYSSPKIESPITIGLFNPIVIIPEKLLETLSENELKSILLHELAHIYHYDQVMGVIKRIVLAVHWWNPLVYIINREHEHAREEVSDNYVLRELHPRVYTQCLADLAEKVCLITNFPTAVGMAGKCFSLPARVEHILSKKRSVAMCTKIYIKTMTFVICLVFTFGIAGLHGKVQSEQAGGVVIDNQVNRSFSHPVPLFEEGHFFLQEEVVESEMIEKQGRSDLKVVSSVGTMLQTESSGKPALKSVTPAIVMEYAGIETPGGREKTTESLRAVQGSVLGNDAEDSVAPVEEEFPVEVSSNAVILLDSRSIGLNTEDPGAYLSRGVSHLKKEQMEDAIADFNKAINLDPTNAIAHIARGSAYFKLDRLDHALSDYNKAIEMNPGLAVAYQNRGTVYERLDQLDHAISDYSNAIEIKPDFYIAYQDRGSVYLKKGRSNEALSDYNKALELNPEDAVTYTCRGTVHFSHGRYKKALMDYNRAIELNPEYSNAYINRGSYYYTKGRYDRAIADYKKALELSPKADFAKKLRKYLHYDGALFLIRVVHHFNHVEKPW